VSGDRTCGARDGQAAGSVVVRVLGAAVFATVCVYAALGTHVLAGGSGASLGVVVTATAVTAVGAFLVSGRRRGRGVLVAAAFAAQYGMHQVFGAGEHGSHHGSGVGMLLAHVLLAVLSAWWLERGQDALVRLLGRSLARLWWAPWRGPVVPVPVRLVPAGGEPPVCVPQVPAWEVSHRGPPRTS
jgi:hypothetical protein